MRRLVDDREQCYRFMRSRDTRFDGRFYVGVTSTGIFCRPSCPARMPRFEHCRFYASAGAALHDGFRACKRCRPAVAPGSPDWVARTDLAARAMRLIADGVVDRGGVEALADRLGYSSRPVHRALTRELGAGPLALAQAQRAQAARTLIESTRLRMTDVAFAAGFESIRQFNHTVRSVFGATPTELRRRAGTREQAAASTVRLRLAARPPFDGDGLFARLAATAVPGVEEWRDGAWRRSLSLDHGPGVVVLRPAGDAVAATLKLTDHRDLASAVARCRWLLDLDADPVAVDAALCEDPVLRPAVLARPGRRVPRCLDAGELALRVVLGVQISTRAARTVAGTIVQASGPVLPDVLLDEASGVTRLFPTAEAVAGMDPSALPMPARRAATLVTLARALADGTVDLSLAAERDVALDALAAVPGVGPWTKSLVAMRALGDPDAFPSGDLGVLQAARTLGLSTPGRLVAHADRWRPWRSYATHVLWGLLRLPAPGRLVAA